MTRHERETIQNSMQFQNKKNQNQVHIQSQLSEDIPQKPRLIISPLLEIGTILKETREKKSLSIREIKDFTRIPIHHIIAIESGARDRLPEDLYLMGFIRNYAKVLGLNEEALVKKYLYSNDKNDHKEEFDMLFEQDNVIRLNTGTNFLRGDAPLVGFFQVYHLYLLIGLFLFGIACFLMIEATKNIQESTRENKAKTYMKQALKEVEEGEEELEATFEFDNEDLIVEAELSMSLMNRPTELRRKISELRENKTLRLPSEEIKKPVSTNEVLRVVSKEEVKEVKEVKNQIIKSKSVNNIIIDKPKKTNIEILTLKEVKKPEVKKTEVKPKQPIAPQTKQVKPEVKISAELKTPAQTITNTASGVILRPAKKIESDGLYLRGSH